MKKFLITILLFIPIIVVLSLTATGAIIANVQNVNASDIFLRDAEYKDLDTNKTIVIDFYDEGVIIHVTVLPAITYSKEIVWEVVSDGGNAELITEDEEGTYRIVPKAAGALTLIIRPVTNRNVYKEISVYITTDLVQEITVFDEDGVTVGEGYKLNGKKRFFVDAKPFDALDQTYVEWGTCGSDTATVTDDGVATPRKRGIVDLFVTIKSRNGKRYTEYFTVDTTECLVNTHVVYASNVVDAERIKRYYVVDDTATVEKTGENTFYVSNGTQSATIKVLPCEKYDWRIASDYGKAYTMSGAYKLAAEFLDTFRYGSIFNVSYKIVDDDLTAEILDGNVLVPRRAGSVRIEATLEGEAQYLDIEVRERAYGVSLSLGKADAERGIEMTRVWGYNFLNEDGTVTHDYKLSAKIDTSKTDIAWISDNTDYATVDDDGLVTFKAPAIGNTVTISAVSVLGAYLTEQKGSFTFIVLDDASATNLTTCENFLSVVNTHDTTAVLQSDIVLEGVSRVNLETSIYGNGFLFDCRKVAYIDGYKGFMFCIDRLLQPPVCNGGAPIEFRNFSMLGADSFEDSANCVAAFHFRGTGNKINISYVKTQYFSMSIDIRDALYETLTIDGCMLGDGAIVGMSIASSAPSDYEIVLRNTVFKKTSGPSILTKPLGIDRGEFWNSYIPKFRIEGFLDCYNWTSLEELKSLAKVVGSMGIDFSEVPLSQDALFSAINLLLEDIFNAEENANLIYKDEDGKGYFNIGLFALGIYGIVDPNSIVCEDDGLELLTLNLSKTTSLGKLLVLTDAILKQRDSRYTIFNTTYILSYSFDSEEGPRNRPNDPVPENDELFARLRYGNK